MIRANAAGFILSFSFDWSRERLAHEHGAIMIRKYRNDAEIYELLRLFETGTIARDEWKHAEHLVVALCYLKESSLGEATDKMRSGIFNLLRAFEVDLKKEMPYHETITVFWMRTAYAYMLMNENRSFVEMANGLCELYDKDHPLNFYSRDLLFSDRARAEFVEPDLLAMPA
jgi:hypothetical protein